MKRHSFHGYVVVAIAVTALALFAAGCGGDDGDDASDTTTDETRPEDPESGLIADKAMLTAEDFPAWWSEVEVDPGVGQALIDSNAECEGLSAAELTSGTQENAKSGPASFQELDGIRRLDIEISTYPEEAEAEAFLASLEENDAPACLTAVLDGVIPGGLAEPAAWTTPPDFGDESLAITINIEANEDVPEDVTQHFIWVRVGRAVTQILYNGPTADNLDNYVNTVSTRLSEQLAGDEAES